MLQTYKFCEASSCLPLHSVISLTAFSHRIFQHYYFMWNIKQCFIFFCTGSHLFTFILSFQFYWHIRLKSAAYFFDPPSLATRKWRAYSNPTGGNSGGEVCCLRLPCCRCSVVCLCVSPLVTQFESECCRKFDIMDSMLFKLEKYADNLEVIVQHRTAELKEEKHKTDMLLCRMLPPYAFRTNYPIL